MTKIFNKVAIVGIGLIGGSLGLDIKKRKLAETVIGVSRHKESLVKAKEIGAIDIYSQRLDIIEDADFLILATPVNTIINLASQIKEFVNRDCIVTDVGSTKEKIVACLNKSFPNYVGSHPMAGSEKRGIANARIGLFKGSVAILTPTRNSSKLAFNKLNLFWRSLGAKVTVLTPMEHDKILAFVSHLPHVTAFSLIQAVPRKYLRFCSTGLQDTTRIAASSAEIWADIFLSNRANIMDSIGKLEGNISQIKKAIKENNRLSLVKILKQAREKREDL